jgi:hypothetical protein
LLLVAGFLLMFSSMSGDGGDRYLPGTDTRRHLTFPGPRLGRAPASRRIRRQVDQTGEYLRVSPFSFRRATTFSPTGPILRAILILPGAR